MFVCVNALKAFCVKSFVLQFKFVKDIRKMYKNGTCVLRVEFVGKISVLKTKSQLLNSEMCRSGTRNILVSFFNQSSMT